MEARDKIVFSLQPGNDTNVQGGATQNEQWNATENGHNGGTQTRPNNGLQKGHGGETRTSTEPDNETQNGQGGETCTSTEPDNGTQNGQRDETRTSTEPDNGTQNGQGGETRSSTEPDSGTQNGQSGETRTVQDNAVQNTESRTRRKKANKDRQYLQDKHDGREKTGRRNPEVAPRLRRRKLHEKEQDVHENEKEEEVVKCQAFLCQEWIACDKCERWLHFDTVCEASCLY